jgi:hypothetical protein
MQVEGLSAQKNVHSCTFFCAYGNLGMKIKDQGSGIGSRKLEANQLKSENLKYRSGATPSITHQQS